jgi:hypothetical protein
MSLAPTIASETSDDGVIVALTGDWTIRAGAGLERQADALVAAAGAARRVTPNSRASHFFDSPFPK